MSTVLPTPLLISEAFGTDASNPTFITLPIPVPDQTGILPNLASFETGFPPNTFTPQASGGLPFFGQDLNGLLWMITAYIANFAAGHFSQHDPAQSTAISGYPLGAILLNDNESGFWLSLADGNTTDPDTGGANWYPVATVGGSSIALTTGTRTLTALESARPYIFLSGTITGNVNVILPTNAGQQWIVVNTCTGAFTVTTKTASGTGVVVPATGQAAPTSIYSDGASIFNTGVSTAGLAPIASPALTGVPIAPTAATSANTTQIATTAFVKAAIAAALAAYAPLASPVLTGNPTAPTQSNADSTLKLATTAFVHNLIAALVPDQKSGTFSCTNGTVSVSFGHTFASPPRVFVQWNYANPDAGFVVGGSITTTGFQYTNGNAGLCDWFATLA